MKLLVVQLPMQLPMQQLSVLLLLVALAFVAIATAIATAVATGDDEGDHDVCDCDDDNDDDCDFDDDADGVDDDVNHGDGERGSDGDDNDVVLQLLNRCNCFWMDDDSDDEAQQSNCSWRCSRLLSVVMPQVRVEETLQVDAQPAKLTKASASDRCSQPLPSKRSRGSKGMPVAVVRASDKE